MSFPYFLYMTDRHRSNALQVIPRLPAHSMVVIRDYDHPSRTEYAHRLAQLAHRHGHEVSVARDAMLARNVKAQGLHLPEYLAQKLPYFKRKHPSLMISVACHHPSRAAHYSAKGADAVMLSPIFATDTHPDASGMGIQALRSAAYANPNRIIALGGIKQCHLPVLITLPLAGIAAIGLYA